MKKLFMIALLVLVTSIGFTQNYGFLKIGEKTTTFQVINQTSPTLIYGTKEVYYLHPLYFYKVELAGYIPMVKIWEHTILDTLANYTSNPIYEAMQFLEEKTDYFYKDMQDSIQGVWVYPYLSTWRVMVGIDIGDVRDSLISDIKHKYDLQ